MHLLAFADTIQLFPDGTLFIHVALILLMIWVLNRTLYKPINKVLAEREKNKGGHSSEAVALLKDVEGKEAQYNRELLDARTKGYELTEKEQKKATAAREQKLAEAKANTADQFEKGKAELEKLALDARKTVQAEAEKMSDKIAANILNS